MKGRWCEHNPNIFCQEEAGCDNCEIFLSAKCPIDMPKFYCEICPHCKQGLCDYPYIGAEDGKQV